MLELIPSPREKKNGEITYKGVLNHFIYVKERSADRITWVCKEKWKSECSARLQTDLKIVVVCVQLNNHRNHIAYSSKLKVLEALRTLKLQAVETQEATSTIVATARHQTSIAAPTHLPLADSLRHAVCRYRVATLGKAVQVDIQMKVIPQRFWCYQQMNVMTGHGYTEQRFLQFDTNEAEYDEDGERVYDKPRIIVFGPANGLKILHESQDWFCDGTFEMTPEGFSQHYTIHCCIDKGELGVYTLPCLFILMPNRQTCTYVWLFIALPYYSSLTPLCCMTDFKEAAMHIFKEVWPDVHLSGCFFHLAQNQRKKLAQLVCSCHITRSCHDCQTCPTTASQDGAGHAVHPVSQPGRCLGPTHRVTQSTTLPTL
uniref:MULE transposase domain-containing protein n=1 Tax=Plectus sambesii TaxID=2011161 RepID=A0A914XMS0_9BILA